MEASTLIRDLSAIFLVGSGLGLAARAVRLPSIVGFLLAGYLMGPYSPFGFRLFGDVSRVRPFSELGMLLLLFSLGLEMGFRKLRALGLQPVIIASLEVIGVWFVGTMVAQKLGMGRLEALFVGATLAISSTTVIMTVLKQKGLRSSHFADVLVGILLVEDLFAILMFVGLPTAASGFDIGGLTLLAGVVLVSVFLWWLFGTLVVPRYVTLLHRHGGDELLLIASVGLAFGLAFVASSFQLSAALGAFVMGAILADTRLIRRIEERVEPLRQVLGLLFFVSFGMLFNPAAVADQWQLALALLVTLVLGKALFSFSATLLAGKNLRDAVRVSFGLTNIGEFSFALAELGVALHILSPDSFSVIVAIGVGTVFLTPLSVDLAGRIALFLRNHPPGVLVHMQESYATALAELSRSMRLPQDNGKYTGFLRALKDRYELLTQETTTATLKRLAPWDEYLSEVIVNSDSAIAGKSLRELDLRRNSGVNVVAIERDFQTLIPPDPDVRLLPRDELLVYGSEPDIASFAEECMSRDYGSPSVGSLKDCELRVFRVSSASSLAGRSLLEAGLRERFHCTLLAVVREGERLRNPPPEFQLAHGDDLVVVGLRASLEKLHKRIGT